MRGQKMAKNYLNMNDFELNQEIYRVQVLLSTNNKPFTQKQNRKYLEKLLKERKNRSK